jgi:hypothetical protein
MRREKRVRVNVKRVNLRELYEQLFVKLDELYAIFLKKKFKKIIKGCKWGILNIFLILM